MVKRVYIEKGGIVKTEKTVPLSRAVSILTSSKKKYCVRAVRQGDNATLTMMTYRCPHCGKTIPAPSERICNKNDVALWAGVQQSFFDSDPLLCVSQPPVADKIRCNRCHKKQAVACADSYVTVAAEDGQITVSREVTDIGEYFEISDRINIDLNFSDELTERVRFDIVSGEIRLEYLQSQKVVYSAKTGKHAAAIVVAIDESRVVKRALRVVFGIATESMPFSRQELSFSSFCLMTRFVGYNRDFYNSIPYSGSKFRIDESFESVAPLLHNHESVIALVNDAELPKVKSLRRLLYRRPAMLFYIKECEILARAIKKVDYLRRILELPNVFGVLSTLHNYPALADFYTDYCKERGEDALVRRLTWRFESFNDYGCRYSAMSEPMKRAERKSWNDDEYESMKKRSLYSVLMAPPPANIPDCKIDGYRFRWLVNSLDYEKAAEQMNNCLDGFTASDSPVCVIYNESGAVAAAQVDGDMVVQQYLSDNLPITEDSPVFYALEKWRKKYNLLPFYDDNE